MAFTGVSLIVSIVTFIHLMIAALHYFAASKIEQEADSIYHTTQQDPLGADGDVRFRDVLATSKFNLKLSVIICVTGLIPSLLWYVSPSVAGGLAICLPIAGISLGVQARRQIKLADQALETHKLDHDTPSDDWAPLSPKEVFVRGMSSLQQAMQEPLVVNRKDRHE